MKKLIQRTQSFLPLFLGSCLLVSATPPQDAAFLKRIRDYWTEGDMALAKKQITAYLTRHEEGSLREELHLLLGDLYLQEGNFVAALDEYSFVQKNELLEKLSYNKALCLYETKKTEELLFFLSTLSPHRHLSQAQLFSLKALCASNLYELSSTSDGPKEEWLNQAISLLQECKHSDITHFSLPLLTRCYILLGDKQKAAQGYLALAKQNPEEEASFLFEGAYLLIESSPEKALSLFEKLAASENPKQAVAAYNSLLLQYQMKHYKQLVLSYEKQKSLLTQEQKYTLSYLLGKSLYSLKDYQQAPQNFLFFLQKDSGSDALKKEAYLLALECFYKTQDLPSYETTLKMALESTKEHSIYEEALYAHLDLLLHFDQKALFIQKASAFLSLYPHHKEKEKIQVKLIYALYESKDWLGAQESISSFLAANPATSLYTHLLRLQMNCCTILLQNSSKETLFIHRENLISIAQKALATPDVLNSTEKEKVLFELAKNTFLQGNFTQALSILETFLLEFSTSPSYKEALHIIVLCHIKEPRLQEAFIPHTEQLLALKTEKDDFLAIEIHLFNAYLESREHAQEEEKQPLFNKAANLLYSLFDRKKGPLQETNIQWLAEHYYTQASSLDSDSAQKAIELLEHLLICTKEKQEENLLRLTQLLSTPSHYQKKAALLDRWLESNSFTGSAIQKNLIIDLAHTHAFLGNHTRALELYDTLIRCTPSSQIGFEALLGRCKVLFATLPEENKIEGNEQYEAILHNLKDLENSSMLLDLLQLEAGLEYIEYRVAPIQNPVEKAKKTAQLLTLFKDSFSSPVPTDPLVKSYLDFVDLELLLLEKNQDTLSQATQILNHFLNDKSIPTALKERALKRNKELNSSI